MNKRHVFTWLFVTIAVLAMGQTDKRYIEVAGSAEADIDPNIIIISVQLREYSENKEKVTLDKIEADFNTALTKSKVPKENVRLADLSSNAFRPRKMERDSYLRKTFEITFSKSPDVLNFLDNLSDVKIEDVHVAKLSHTEIQKYRLETKVSALKAAEMKAEVLLSSVGSKKGKVLLIEERPELQEWASRNLGGNAMYSNAVTLESVGNSQGVNDIPLKKIHLRFEIMARFEIE
jgi:uncharacterized protein YggE